MKLRKKIVYVVNNLTTGGVTQIIKSTSITLCKYYDISIVSLSSKDSVWPNSHPVKVKYFDSNIIFEYSLINYFQDIVFGKVFRNNYKEVINFIISKNPDYLHFHTLPRFLKIGLLVKKKYDCQLVFTDHLVRISPKEYTLLIRTFLGIIYKQVYKHFNLIFVSKPVKDVAIKYGFIAEGNKHVQIDNGIDLTFYSTKAREENKKVIFIYIARISPVKGHEALINSWSKIKSDSERELWLVGPNEMGDKIQNLIDKTACNNIKMLGSRNEIKELLLAADIAVFPSLKEGLPLSLLEKMAMGLPVIVSDIDELTTVIEHEKNGLTYELGNDNDLTDKMSILLNNKEMRRELGGEARKKVEENYSLLSVVEKTKLFYKSL
tara:strand:+ start:248 stop:1381 length:1134 start_codon:yes stop_codon:yes gene_type:complete